MLAGFLNVHQNLAMRYVVGVAARRRRGRKWETVARLCRDDKDAFTRQAVDSVHRAGCKLSAARSLHQPICSLRGGLFEPVLAP